MNKESSTAILMDELATPLVRYLAKKVPNTEDANDLAQEAFLRMHKFQQSKNLGKCPGVPVSNSEQSGH